MGIGLGFVEILEREAKDSKKETDIEKNPLTDECYSNSLQEETNEIEELIGLYRRNSCFISMVWLCQKTI